ncbi:MAG: hypothetical protein AB4372_11335 [Xenococcus sp. (in: cyanobacteria)]|nr:hypothetical protein [Xenococcaceae cyanobacterium MO_167.B52]
MKWEHELGKQLANRHLFVYRLPFAGIRTLMLAGIGTLVLAPIIIPAVSKAGKSVAKTAIKGGLSIYEGGKELVSEARAELATASPDE